jgi:hypothetical protein
MDDLESIKPVYVGSAQERVTPKYMTEDTPIPDSIESVVPDITRARAALMAVILRLHQHRDPADHARTYDFFKKDEEAIRKHFLEWLPTTDHLAGTPQERATHFIITALYTPTLNTLARTLGAELKVMDAESETGDMQRWQVAAAYVNAWKLIEQALKERFESLPEGKTKEYLREPVMHITEMFTAELPPRNVQ